MNSCFTGSFGYRGPGSDYGDHGNQRRVSGSWYGDSGDDASETSSICSERPLEVCVFLWKVPVYYIRTKLGYCRCITPYVK